MYTAQLTIERIQSSIKQKGLTQKFVLSECGISENTVKKMTDNKGISSFYLAKIADFLDCSVDYLLGRTDQPEISQSSSNTNATSNTQNEISKEDLELLELFHKLPIRKQAEIITAMAQHID